MRRTILAAPGTFLLGLLACSTGPSDTGRVTFQLSTGAAVTGGGSGPQGSVSVTSGADVITVTRVRLVARKIDFEQAAGSCTPPAPSSGSESEAEHSDPMDPECPELRLGPMLLDPPVSDGAESSFSVDLPAGTYREVEMQIHKPADANGDAVFLAAHPEFAGASIIVDGTWNGAPFSFSTALTTRIEVEFDAPIEVTAGGTTNVTLQMDVRGWFLAGGSGPLLNPLLLTQQARATVEQNIRTSFHAFRDQNCDGQRD